MAMKIATGSEIFNLLSNPTATASQVGPLSSSGSAAVPIGASGYIATGFATVPASVGYPSMAVPAGSGAAFPVGTAIVVDDDYANQYGLIGYNGISVFKNAVTDIDFFRKTSDFVNRVVAVIPAALATPSQDVLVLNGPFVGGGNAATGTPLNSPSPNAKVQAIKGWTAREGGSTITEYTALFCLDTVDGDQIAIFYPHVSANQFKDIGTAQIENIGTTDLTQYTLECVMTALAYDDPLDGETVVRYAAFYPSPATAVQI
jgi:hypothetical protein